MAASAAFYLYLKIRKTVSFLSVLNSKGCLEVCNQANRFVSLPLSMEAFANTGNRTGKHHAVPLSSSSEIVVLCSFTYVSATFSLFSPQNESESNEADSIGTAIATRLVETFSQKIQILSRVFKLKVRIIRFLVSLITTDNLLLLRNLIEFAISIGDATLTFLPTSNMDPAYWWLPALSEFLSTSLSSGGSLGILLGEPRITESASEAASENTYDILTNPPIFYNAPEPSGTTVHPDSNKISDEFIRKSRDAAQVDENGSEDDGVDQSGIGDDNDDTPLKMYEGRIMTLDKLINARRK